MGSYATWRKTVEAILGKYWGVGTGDLGDWPWEEMWESGDSPSQAIRAALEDEGLL